MSPEKKLSRGFTLPEILIALAIISVITMVTLGALQPWLEFRQGLETDRKLSELREAARAYYRDNALAVEQGAANTFGPLKASTLSATKTCDSQADALAALGYSISEAGEKAAKDGFGNAFCVLVGPQRFKAVDGVRLYYRVLAFVSTGTNAQLDPGTQLNPVSDALELKADDRGTLVSTLDIEQDLYATTTQRMEKVARMYETYFTTRFLAAADRDISRYYFHNDADTAGTVAPTGTNWIAANVSLSTLGVSDDMGLSAWGTPIQVNNDSGQVPGGTLRPRTPATVAPGTLPYTALLIARLPAPSGEQYIVRTAAGNY